MNSLVIAKYLRLSDEDADLKHGEKIESNSIQNQRNLLDMFIRNNPELAEAGTLEFCDDGWSGKNFERPAFQKMISMVRQGEIHCIIVKDISRFGRDYLTVGNYISRIFPFLEVRFIAVNDGFDSIRPMDVDSLETSFKTLLYDLYSRDLSRKTRSAKQFRAQRGEFLSPFAPYGYMKNPDNRKQLLIDPDAAVIVKRIFQMTADGQTTHQIAKILNKEDVLTPMRHKRASGCSRTVWPSIHNENFWTHELVTRILRDERYVGMVVYGKRTRDMVGHVHTVKVSRTDWITVDNTHEGIVTREQFDRAQASLRPFMERNSSPLGDGVPMNKKVRCGICGHVMVRHKTKRPYYRCETSRVTDTFLCTEERLSEGDLMEGLQEGLHVQALLAVELGRLWDEQQRKDRRSVATTIKELASLKEERSQIGQQIKELYESFALGEISKTEYLAAKGAAIERKDTLVARIGELEAKLENTGANGSLNNRFVSNFQKYVEVKEITQEIATDVIGGIFVYPGGRFEIVWNYREEFERILMEVDIPDSSFVKMCNSSLIENKCEISTNI